MIRVRLGTGYLLHSYYFNTSSSLSTSLINPTVNTYPPEQELKALPLLRRPQLHPAAIPVSSQEKRDELKSEETMPLDEWDVYTGTDPCRADISRETSSSA